HFTLIANLNISKLALFVLDDDWNCKVNYGTVKNFKNQSLSSEILAIHAVSDIKENLGEFNEFDQIIPIFHKATALAYVFISSNTGNSTEDVNTSFIRTFTNIIIVAIENKKLARKELAQQAFRKEMEIAREVQSFLFPKNLPDNHRVLIKASYHPHDSIGGDYYDYIKISEDSFLVCIADVSGKGIPAALLMSNFQASLRTLVRQTKDLKQIIAELNYNILDNAKGERFITFFIALFDLTLDKIKYINAGHNPPILISNGNAQLLDKGTTILGVFNKLPFVNEQEIDLPHDSILFAYTDGLTETATEEGEEYGNERLQEYLLEQNMKENDELHIKLYEELVRFKGKTKFPDDITYWSCLIR
ncbi:MAG TPA: PP2C family protein-serine/threonine phosphatase, partial [Cytophagaceae bacterium]|nr:PP2C family protein-serine/threonine phosphatase [Cytophagaceae bacterium]